MDKETSEIAKLTERIAKDPRSKLFVPLAEEYKKSGDLEMAIHVLTEGLKNNPGYVTARSFLGKLFIEKGDLPAAQKEFEEVVKAIPDNLMAQRKLGDLCAVQNRPEDALRHYRTVLTLNPKDSETSMLVAEADAGRDITKHLALSKIAAAAAELQKEQEQAPASPQPGRPAKAGQTGVKPAQTAAVAQEEPEEIFVVEPLEDAGSGAPTETVQKPAAADFDFLDESMQAAVASDETTQPPDDLALDASFSLSEPVPDEEFSGSAATALDAPFTLQDEVSTSEQQSEQNPFAIEDPFAVQEAPAADEGLVEEPLFELNEPGGHAGEGPAAAADADVITAEIVEEPEKQADDFTTDTLAELYISQGFFEKAVDIYERMLVDKPNSQGLKDKLVNVRAMAAAAGQEAGPDAGAPSEADERMTAAVPDRWGDIPASEGFVPPPAAQPRLDDWELPAAAAIPPPEEQKPARPRSQPKPFDIGFEPREYVPPDAIPRQSLPEQEQVPDLTEAELSVSRKPSDARKKETVDRLESWLKNIIKEN